MAVSPQHHMGRGLHSRCLALEPRIMLDAAGTTTLISATAGGAEGNDTSMSPSVDADGTAVAFASKATNLNEADADGNFDIFISIGGQVERANVSGGTAINGGSVSPSVNDDGNYIAFESTATNLVGGDTNGASDIFLRDRDNGFTVRVSLQTGGGQANGPSYDPSISDGGYIVAFASDATDLYGTDNNSRSDVFVHSLYANQTTLVSSDVTGTQTANGPSGDPSLSADGNLVAFESQASDLVAGDGGGHQDIFLRSIIGSQTWRISEGYDGSDANGNSFDPAISGDGGFVAFTSDASNLVAGDTNGVRDVFLYNVGTGQTTRLSTAFDGGQANGHSTDPSISDDGRYVSFTSNASNLVSRDGSVSSDTNGTSDIFVHDTITGQTIRLSLGPGAVQANGSSFDSSISGDGTYVAFASNATNLVAGDGNGKTDVFLRNVDFSAVIRIEDAADDPHAALPLGVDDDEEDLVGRGSTPPDDQGLEGRDGDDLFGSAMSSDQSADDISPDMGEDTTADPFARIGANLPDAIDAMADAGLSPAEQARVFEAVGADAIVRGLADSDDPTAAAVNRVLVQVRQGEPLDMGDLRRDLTTRGVDPDTVMGYLAAFAVVEKAVRADMFSAALAQLVDDPDASGFVVPPAEALEALRLPPGTTRAALLIGVADYQDPIRDLGTPLADVLAMSEVLADRFGYVPVVLSNPTKAEIVAWIAAMTRQMGEGTSLVIYYAGHGFAFEATGVGYWLPADARADSAANWISTRELSSFLDQARSDQVMVISDSCFSGAFTREERIMTVDPATLQGRAITAMSSGGEAPVSDEGFGSHSVFAGNLLATLRTSEGDDLGQAIFSEVRGAVSKTLPQQPTYGGLVSAGHERGADFVIGGRP